MLVSVIIPTFQAENYIAELLSCLRRQTVPELEIIVVDSSSSDRTAELAAKSADRVIVIPKQDFNHGGTRNRAAGEAQGEILVFLTQDALPVNEHFLAELLKPLADNRAAASYGRQVAGNEASVVERYARGFNYPAYDMLKSQADLDRLGIKTFFFTNVCSAVKREAFMAVGGFNERVILNEDMILAAELILSGYKIAYCSQAMVCHSHSYSFWQQFQRNFDIGVSLRMNDWILAYARPENEGWRYFKNLLRYLVSEKEYKAIIRCFIDTVFRYIGYKAGLKFNLLPVWLRRIFSMHSFFWDE